jgi:hypothetical protein
VGKIGSISLFNIFCKLSFSFGQRVFESISFRSVKVGFRLFGVLVSCAFCQLPKIRLCVKMSSCLRRRLFQSASLQVQPRLTKRAPDKWESAAFFSSFLASSFFCSQAFSQPAHLRVTQTVRWLRFQQSKGNPKLNLRSA